ncbi:hypothetical protein Mapa_013957 [Marchantia paleacea]|nr:hypothetical protein Mapa_013957 [Marchantia paleacea]
MHTSSTLSNHFLKLSSNSSLQILMLCDSEYEENKINTHSTLQCPVFLHLL